MSIILLILALAICIYTSLAGKPQYQKFSQLRNTADRVRFYRRWIIESWLLFGGFAVVALLLTDNSHHLLHPIMNSAIKDVLPASLEGDSAAFQGFGIGIGIGLLVAMTAAIIRARRSVSKLKTAGNFDALMPENTTERNYAALLSVSAGINEELFFRAMLPVLLLVVFHNPQVAIVISVVIFGLEHLYQGWKGVIATLLIGGILMKLFIFSGTLLAPMALHAFIDLNSLVVFPYLASLSQRKKNA